MRIVEIRDEGEFDRLRARWHALLRSSRSSTIFLTWEWLSAWWLAYGAAGELRILAAFDADNVLRGLAPLRKSVVGEYGQKAPALSFLGDGSNDSDYLDFICAAEFERPVMRS